MKEEMTQGEQKKGELAKNKRTKNRFKKRSAFAHKSRFAKNRP